MPTGRASSLNPTALTRLRQVLQPDWVHTVRARRIAAAALVVLAGVAAVRANPDGDRASVLVAVRDLAPGVALTAADVRIEGQLAATVPDGAQSDLATIEGATLAGPVRRGEVLTDVRVLGPRLVEATAGPGARMVPVQLADSAVLDVIRGGDIVDILAAPDSEPDATARVIATDAVVVLVSGPQKGAPAAHDRVVLVALPAPAANTVAGAALVQALTLTLH
ncbi:SAF domain-containing protein [[Mycobacterium] burgundiense]|uniref:SAF domain-containing protein n=1 Tax=[Mycobacterium] burgundiense TaxID=3064286 RepID=A0ABM9LDG1_9MYCO|nr:SAF domain-containing protein [Mycolicibacterium sp. MU0053]CAJ1497180.1 SAF domain-containing protein [Mycolicibacterium sp. MU0053]